MTGPRQIDRALRDELRARFTAAQIVELTLDVTAWNKQKVLVALDLDAPRSERGLSPMTFDAAGRPVVGEPG